MKKIKLLSCTAMVAFMALGLASCEKENFTTEIETPEINVPTITIPGIDIPEDGAAVIAIQPTVIGCINNEIKTITDDCTITYNGKSTFEYTVNEDKGISPTTVEIVAEYEFQLEELSNTFSATQKIEVPALSAGMIAVITPTLIINANGEITGMNIEEVEWADVETEGKVELVNTNKYFYTDYEATYSYPIGRKVIEKNIDPAFTENTLVNRWIEANNDRSDFETLITVPYLYAESSTIIPWTSTTSTTKYKIVKSAEWSRNAETTEVVAATFTVEDLWMKIFDTNKCEYTESTSGHGSHYHGHGHGDANNAGGGISWAE